MNPAGEKKKKKLCRLVLDYKSSISVSSQTHHSAAAARRREQGSICPCLSRLIDRERVQRESMRAKLNQELTSRPERRIESIFTTLHEQTAVRMFPHADNS